MSLVKHRAFTLMECIAALALFAIVAVLISQTCFNCLSSVDRIKKDSYKDALADYVRGKILACSSLEEFQNGFDIYDQEGNSVTISGDAEPTDIIDLFILTVECEDLHYKESFYLLRPDWYNQLKTNFIDREEILDDRRDYLDDTRKLMQ